MWPWKKNNTNNSYKDILLKGFPESIREDVEVAFEIIPLDHNIKYRFDQVIKIDNLIHSEKQIVILDNEALEIPSRIYFNEPSTSKKNDLTDIQKSVLDCIYLRHHDGMVRQKHLDFLLEKGEYFITPYKFHLLGEYVIEILNDFKKHITTNSIESFVKFAIDNEKYFVQIESKMASYWNAHYRGQYRNLKEYIGRQNIDEIKKRTYNKRFCAIGA